MVEAVISKWQVRYITDRNWKCSLYILQGSPLKAKVIKSILQPKKKKPLQSCIVLLPDMDSSSQFCLWPHNGMLIKWQPRETRHSLAAQCCLPQNGNINLAQFSCLCVVYWVVAWSEGTSDPPMQLTCHKGARKPFIEYKGIKFYFFSWGYLCMVVHN